MKLTIDLETKTVTVIDCTSVGQLVETLSHIGCNDFKVKLDETVQYKTGYLSAGIGSGVSFEEDRFYPGGRFRPQCSSNTTTRLVGNISTEGLANILNAG